MTVEKVPAAQPLTCPKCQFIFPLKAAFFTPEWKRYICPVCKTTLAPVTRHTVRISIAFATINYACLHIIAWILRPSYGYAGVAAGWIVYVGIILYIAIIVSARFTYFKAMNDNNATA